MILPSICYLWINVFVTEPKALVCQIKNPDFQDTPPLWGNPSPALTCQLQEKDERSSFFSIDLRESAAINYPNNELAISLFASVSRLSSPERSFLRSLAPVVHQQEGEKEAARWPNSPTRTPVRPPRATLIIVREGGRAPTPTWTGMGEWRRSTAIFVREEGVFTLMGYLWQNSANSCKFLRKHQTVKSLKRTFPLNKVFCVTATTKWCFRLKILLTLCFFPKIYFFFFSRNIFCFS